MGERRPFADDIPELELHRTEGCGWALDVELGEDYDPCDPSQKDRALVRAGIRIGEQRERAKIAKDLREHASWIGDNRNARCEDILEADALRIFAEGLEANDD